VIADLRDNLLHRTMSFASQKKPCRLAGREDEQQGTWPEMLKMLILVCSANVSPVDCQLETALDVIHGPQVASVMECGVQGQALVARTTVLRHAPNEYMKIKCSPQKRG
jgi:hypothetical protein